MSLINSIASWLLKKRMHQIELFIKYPFDVQNEWMHRLISEAQDTEFGRKHNFKTIRNYEQFKREIPLHHESTPQGSATLH